MGPFSSGHGQKSSAFVIRDIVNYFGITANIRSQLRYLDNLGYCWFRRLLFQKHRSVGGVQSLMHKFYYTKDGRVFWNKEKQFKTCDIKPLGNLFVDFFCLSKSTGMASIYLDSVELKKGLLKSLVWQEILKDYRISFKILEKTTM